jgi:hypothetical protein
MSFGVFQFRRGTAASWTSANPTLSAGEMGIETDTAKFKVGDGTTAWASLAYGGIQGPQGVAGTSPNAFLNVTGNTGTATADTSSDSLLISGANGIVTTATDNPEVLAITPTYGTTSNTFAQGNDSRITGAVQTTRTLTGTAPITIDGVNTGVDLSANRTVAIAAATTSAAGSLSALDKAKLDNMYLDVTANSIAIVSPGNTAAANVTAINAILAGAPSGTTIFFPKGEYSFNAAWTWPSKFFYLLGQGQNRDGAESELKWTSNVAGNCITLTDGFWYSRFTNLTFTTTVDQTAGYAIQCGNNVGINFQNCTWQTAGGFFNNCVGFDSGGNAGNSCFMDKCIVSGFKGTGIRVSSAGTSVVISDTQVLGQWGPSSSTPASAQALAGISGGWVGALQINDCDVIGCQNNLLLNPSLAGGEVCASVFCTNTYFDNSGGSCIKITGTGATVRCRFDTCSFTTAGTNFTTAGTNLSAVELASTFAYAAGGQGLDFVNCNVLNTFATTGTTNGFLISGTADFSIGNSRISGWTNGVQVTPIATAGRTQCQINNNTIGAAAGFASNGTGILLNAGSAAYGSMVIESNILDGNTTAPITDNSAVAPANQKSVNGNPGTVAGGLTALASGGATALANSGRGAVTSGTAETFLATYRIPGGAVSVGDVIQITAIFQATGTGTGTLTPRIRCGTGGAITDALVNIAGVSAASTLNSLTIVNCYVYVAALGPTATVSAAIQGTSTAAAFNNAVVAETLGNVVTTAPWFITLAGTSSVASHTIRSIKAHII